MQITLQICSFWTPSGEKHFQRSLNECLSSVRFAWLNELLLKHSANVTFPWVCQGGRVLVMTLIQLYARTLTIIHIMCRILGHRVAELEKKLKTLEVSGLWSLQGLSQKVNHVIELCLWARHTRYLSSPGIINDYPWAVGETWRNGLNYNERASHPVGVVGLFIFWSCIAIMTTMQVTLIYRLPFYLPRHCFLWIFFTFFISFGSFPMEFVPLTYDRFLFPRSPRIWLNRSR